MGKINAYGIKMRRRTSRRALASKPAMLQINLSGSMARRVLKSLLAPLLPPPPPVVPQTTPTSRPTLKTVDQVIISADVMKQELFYVAASRGREGIAIVTSDVERLGQSLGVSMARPSAIELANEISQSKQSLEHHAGMNPKQVIEALKPPRDMGFEQGIGLGF